MAGGKCSAKADVFPCGPRDSERSAQDVEGVGSRKAAGGRGGGTGEERNPAGVSGQVGELTYRTRLGSGLEGRRPALAGLKSLLGLAGGRCTLLTRQVLMADSIDRGSESLAATTVKALRALPSLSLHCTGGAEKRTQLFYGELSRMSQQPVSLEHLLYTRYYA